MLWIPVTVFAAFAQTVRNAAQRQLIVELGTLGATLVRFLYGLPFALAWLVVVAIVWRDASPDPVPSSSNLTKRRQPAASRMISMTSGTPPYRDARCVTTG